MVAAVSFSLSDQFSRLRDLSDLSSSIPTVWEGSRMDHIHIESSVAT